VLVKLTLLGEEVGESVLKFLGERRAVLFGSHLRRTFGRKAQPRKDRKLEDMSKEKRALPWERGGSKSV
jgi:hypothetical protein